MVLLLIHQDTMNILMSLKLDITCTLRPLLILCLKLRIADGKERYDLRAWTE